MTVLVQIGNSDDKLTQAQWAHFCYEVKACIEAYAETFHFCGASAGWEEWQNLAVVFELKENYAEELREELRMIRQKFRQESLAWTVGETLFI